jgi:P4 family phage/plasmid primase-like protien
MLQDTVLNYVRKGWACFPLAGKQSLIPWKTLQERAPSEEQVAAWLALYPEANIGLVLGKVSGVVRVDADSTQAVQHLGSIVPELPVTASFSTPSGGRGWLFKYGGEQTDVLWRGDTAHSELRFMSDGSYTAIPPSSGYAWLCEAEPAPLPDALVRLLLSLRTGRVLKQLEQELSPTIVQPDHDTVLEALRALDPVRCDDRDSWLQVGMALHSAGNEYLESWITWSSSSTKFVPGECEKLWSSFVRSRGVTIRTLLHLARLDGWHSPRLHEPLTDVGNGRVLARLCAGKALYLREWDKWLFWDGKRWKQDAELEVVEQAKFMIRERYDRAAKSLTGIRDLEEGEQARRIKAVAKVLKWCLTSEARGHVHAAVDMAKSEPEVLGTVSTIDTYPWLLNCPNGTLDLRNGQLLPHDQSQLLTQLCPTEYEPTAIAPRWMRFIDEVFQGRTALIAWVQKLLGYALTGCVHEHVLPILFGFGRNGKSTLVKAIQNVLGADYAGTTPSGFLALSHNEQHPTKMVALHGKRFVADLETSDSMRLNEELVKRITGGDELQARRMHEDFWHFKPTHKLFLATNYEPKVRGTDIAVWSRLKLIPFTAVFEGAACDKFLDEKLAVEASGILRWLVEGCTAWQREGLGSVSEVLTATTTYQQDQDTVAQFYSDRLTRDATASTKKQEVQAAYKAWAFNNSVEAVSGKVLAASLLKLGVTANEKYFQGVRLQ